MAAIGTTTASTSGIGDTTPDDIDPATGQPKKATPAPEQLSNIQVNNNDNIIPLTKTAANPATNGSQQPQQNITDTTQGNTAVLLAAQNQAVNQAPNSLTPQLTQKTSEYLQDPNLGFDYGGYNQNALEQYDRQQSQAMEAARQKLGTTSQSGELQNQFLQNQMTASAGRSDLEAKNDYAAAAAKQTNMVNALAQGRATQTGNDTSSTSQINNLATVRGMGEGERAQTTGFQENVALTNLGFDIATQEAAQTHGYDLDTMSKQFGNTMTQLMATQDFTGAQSELSREATAAIDANDTASVTANLQKQLDYNKWAQENGQTFTANQNAINNALQVSLKTLDIQGQKDLATLNGSIQSGLLLTANDFKASEDSLDRAQQTAIQQGDIAGQLQIQDAKAQLDMQAQTAQNDFTATQTLSTQAWQTGERIGTQDAAKIAQYFDWSQKNAEQSATFAQETAVQLQGQTFDEQMKNLDASIAEAKAGNDTTRTEQLQAYQANLNELAATNASVRTMDQMTLQGTIAQSLSDRQAAQTQTLENMKENNALAMQTQDMDQQTKMAYLNNALATAKADGDVGRQEQIIGFQTTQTLETMAAQGDIQAGLDQVQGDIQSALSSQNYVQADALQTSAQIFKAQEDDKANALQQTSLDLQKVGFDYNAIQEAVSNGQITQDAAAKFLNDAATDLGIKVTTADPNAAAAKVLQAQSTQMLQYATTNPKNVNTADLTNGALDISKLPKNADGTYDTSQLLTDAGNADYYDAVNKTIFGTTSTTTGTNASNAPTYDPTQTTGGTNKNFATSAPAAGTTFQINGSVYTASAGGVGKTSGDQSFSAVDNTTGETVQIIAGQGVLHPGAKIYDNGSLPEDKWTIVNSIFKRVISSDVGYNPVMISQALANAGLPSDVSQYSRVVSG